MLNAAQVSCRKVTAKLEGFSRLLPDGCAAMVKTSNLEMLVWMKAMLLEKTFRKVFLFFT